MGYTTDFYGHFTVDPPLNQAEVHYLTKFARTRRMRTTHGPYYVDAPGFMGQDPDPDTVLSYNAPPQGQPGLWCQWEPTEDGTAIVWDGREKFYNAPEWLKYLIDHFLKPGAEASRTSDPQFDDFTFDHIVNGEVSAQGEDPDDHWALISSGNRICVQHGGTAMIAPHNYTHRANGLLYCDTCEVPSDFCEDERRCENGCICNVGDPDLRDECVRLYEDAYGLELARGEITESELLALAVTLALDTQETGSSDDR